VQFGLIFSFLAIVFYGQILENYRSSPHFVATFSTGENCVSILAKNASGNVLGYFFTNSSGHSGANFAPTVIAYCGRGDGAKPL
jgi:hypothetical protein